MLFLVNNQGGHGTGKTGNLDVHFFQTGKTQGICQKILKISFNTGNLPPTQGKF